MALSRFWSFIVVISIAYILSMLLTGHLYTVSGVVNGKQNDPLVISESPFFDIQQTNSVLAAAIRANRASGFQQSDTLYRLLDNGTVEICAGQQAADGIFATCKNTILDLWLPLIGYLTFFCGLLNLLSDSNALQKISALLTPVFVRLFPELPQGHPAYGFMTMNFAANFLGLDNAATPFGLKAMESMQEVNPDKDKASNSQIMFLCLHAAGLTLIPTSIIGYRAAQNAANPADIMLPTIVTSFIGTLAALVFVSLKQRINLLNGVVVGSIAGLSALIGWLLFYITRLTGLAKFHFTGNLSNGALLFFILAIVLFCIFCEKVFRQNHTNIFDSFVHGAQEGVTTGLRILPYMIAMLVALSLLRNSNLMGMVMRGLTGLLGAFHLDPQVLNAVPVALMRPFSAGGSRGFMLEAMKTFGADSLTGRLSCLFQGAAETTFYVVALYFGAVKVKNSRYTLVIMLLVDLVCVISAVLVCRLYF